VLVDLGRLEDANMGVPALPRESDRAKDAAEGVLAQRFGQEILAETPRQHRSGAHWQRLWACCPHGSRKPGDQFGEAPAVSPSSRPASARTRCATAIARRCSSKVFENVCPPDSSATK